MTEFRLLAPTGVLGAGFSMTGLTKAVSMKPHVIACDAGSTDSGPAALGGGAPKLSRSAVRRDLEALLLARDDGVDLVSSIAAEIAGQHRLQFRAARIYSDQDPLDVAVLHSNGKLLPLNAAPQITEKDITDSHI